MLADGHDYRTRLSVSLSSKFDNCSLQQLLAARQSLRTTMRKVSDLAGTLGKSELRIQNITETLPVLEAVMGPLQNKVNEATALSSRIDRVIGPAASVLNSFKTIEELRKSLMADPKDDIQGYVGSVNRLEESLRCVRDNYHPAVKWTEDAVQFSGRYRLADKYRMHRLSHALVTLRELDPDTKLSKLDGGLLEIALEKLVEEFRRILADSSHCVDLSSLVPSRDDFRSDISLPFPNGDTVKKLQVIVKRLQAKGRTYRCSSSFREVRVVAVRNTLQSLEASYLKYSTSDAIDKLDWEVVENYIGLWMQQVEWAVKVLFASERRLLNLIFDDADCKERDDCFGEIVEQGNMIMFFRFGEAIAYSEKQPEKLFKLLDMLEMLDRLKPNVGEVFGGEACMGIRSAGRELQKQLIHSACNTIWEFGKRLEKGERNLPPQNGGNDKLSSYVVNYLKYLVGDYGSSMKDALRIAHGWKDGRVQEMTLSHAITYIMQALERNLEDRAMLYDDPALMHIFLMNNFYYMFIRSRNSELSPYLSDCWLRDCKRKVDQHALKYRKEGWEKVLANLSRDGLQISSGGRGGGRDVIRRRLIAFNEEMEEAYRKGCRWSIPDLELRKSTQLTIVQMVVPAYRNFVQSYAVMIEQVGLTRLMKHTPEALEALLGDLFEGRSERDLPATAGPSKQGHVERRGFSF